MLSALSRGERASEGLIQALWEGVIGLARVHWRIARIMLATRIYACYEDNWFDLMRIGVMDVKGCLVGPKEEQFKRGKIQSFVK